MDRDDLIRELARLRKGRGLSRPGLQTDLGPHLRDLLGVTSISLEEDTRSRLRSVLAEEASGLPIDLRDLASAAFGLTVDAATMSERIASVRSARRVDERTNRRHLVHADGLLADRLALRFTRQRVSTSGWTWATCAHEVDISGSRPTFRSTRVLIPTLDGLDRFDELLTLRDEGAVEIRTGRGCSLLGRERLSATTWRINYAIPRALSAGEPHEVEMTYSYADRDSIQPFCVFVPLRPVDSYEVNLWLGDPPVAEAWILDGVVVGSLFDPPIPEDLVRQPRIVARFDQLVPGQLYGLGWRWD
jgi:hypothetical protein